MSAKLIQITDKGRHVIATAKVCEENGLFTGSIDLSTTSPTLRQTFAEFEEIVNSQVFSLLDEIEARIEAISLFALFEDGRQAAVQDLQVYPSTGQVSFKVRKDAGRRV